MVNYINVPNNTASSWWRDPGMRMGMFHIFILYTANYSLGFDGSLLSGLQALAPWNAFFGSPKGTRLGLIAATYYLPKIPSAFIVAELTDRYGRKLSLYLGAFFMLAGAIVGGFSQNVGQLMGSRVLLGIGTALAQISACAIIPELAHPRLRHHAGAYLNTTYYIGSIFASWLTFSMVYYPGSDKNWAWRIPTLVQGFGPILLALGIYFVPESPRYLIKKGRDAEAHQILAKYHANGDLHDPLVQFEMHEIKTSIEMEKSVKDVSWLAFFQTRGNLRRFFIIIMIGTTTQLVGNGVVQYFLAPVLRQVGITAPPQITGINGGLAIWNWFISMAGASRVEKFGRRPLFLASLAGMLSCFTIITGLAGGYANTGNKSTGVALVPFIFFFMGFYSLALTPLPMAYTPEISPLKLRAKSAALLLLSQNVSQSFNQFVNPIALEKIAWKYYFVYLAVQATYLVLYFFFLRETKGLTVEEAAVVYDSADAKQAAIEAERKLREGAEDLETAADVDGQSLDKDEKRSMSFASDEEKLERS
ncbi:hexose transport-related protein [Atractiella rhizophila]|nr:hexose transport-related protein [Atractiella rhizophila]